jgi:hypothetical protein
LRRIATTLLLVAAGAALVGAIASRSRVGHPVTARMQTAAGATTGRSARPLPGAAWGRPTVLIFIKEGCPCSEAAETCFRRLFAAYGDRASFLGVIDGGPSEARQWVVRHQTPYPVLADPDLAIIRAYGAERSAYTALIANGGTIDRLWPGYSAGMLRELGARLAKAEGVAEVQLDVGDAPVELTSGCSFSL